MSATTSVGSVAEQVSGTRYGTPVDSAAHANGTENLIVGWPAENQFFICGAFNLRFCYHEEHGCVELLLWFEDAWMQDADLDLSEGFHAPV